MTLLLFLLLSAGAASCSLFRAKSPPVFESNAPGASPSEAATRERKIEWDHTLDSNDPRDLELSVTGQTSAGTSAPEAAPVLWEEGKAAFDRGRYRSSIFFLKRLVDRYPGAPGYLEAHRMLGNAYIELKRPDLGIAPLRHYAEALGIDSVAGLRAHLLYGRSLVNSKYFHEAELIADEVEKGTRPILNQERDEDTALAAAEALLLKSEALFGLDHC